MGVSLGSCEETSNPDIYEKVLSIEFLKKAKINSYIGQQMVLWVIVLLPMILVAVALSCILGKLSNKFFCVPFINKDNAKFDETNLEDAKGFKGFGSKIKALVKAITLSGLAVTMVNTESVVTQYPACPGYESIYPTILLSWVASIFAYFFIWKVDFSYGVVKLGIFKKLIWFFLSKIVTLIIGASFVRVVFLQDLGGDTYCYCNDDLLLVANLFTVIYIGLFPVFWVAHKLKVKKLLALLAPPAAWFCKQYFCCKSPNCCCELNVKVPTGPIGAACMKCCGCFANIIPQIIIGILFIMAPSICLIIRFIVLERKWNNYAEQESIQFALDVTDIVFIWIAVIALTFFMIEAVLRLKRKCCGKGGKDAKAKRDRVQTVESIQRKNTTERKNTKERTDTTELEELATKE